MRRRKCEGCKSVFSDVVSLSDPLKGGKHLYLCNQCQSNLFQGEDRETGVFVKYLHDWQIYNIYIKYWLNVPLHLWWRWFSQLAPHHLSLRLPATFQMVSLCCLPTPQATHPTCRHQGSILSKGCWKLGSGNWGNRWHRTWILLGPFRTWLQHCPCIS